MIDMRAVKRFLRAVQDRLPGIIGTDDVSKMRRKLCLDALVHVSAIVDEIEDVLDSGMSAGEKAKAFEKASPGFCETLVGLRARFAEVFLDFPDMCFDDDRDND